MGVRKHGKNGPKPVGRPSKRMRCDGSGLKLSAAVERSTMDASCRLYNIGLQLERTQHEAAREHARKRAHQYKVLQRSVPTQTVQPPKHHSNWDKWLRESVSSITSSKAVKAVRPLVLSHTLFHEGRLSSECEQLGRLWVAYWAVGRVRTTYTAERGFGVVAAVQVGSGQVVARGVIEKDYDEPHYKVKGGGTMYGPAALVNAACREECANAIFRVEKGVWCVQTKRGLRVGEEVLVHYPAQGQCVCGATQWD